MTELPLGENIQPDGILADDALLNYYTTEARRHYSTGIQATINFGNCLAEAKVGLSAQAWRLFTEDKSRCPVGSATASKYMSIAANANILKTENWLFFPFGWNVLYEISLLTDEQFADGIRPRIITADGIREGIINPDSTMDDIKALRGKTPRSKTPKPQSATPKPAKVELAALTNAETDDPIDEVEVAGTKTDRSTAVTVKSSSPVSEELDLETAKELDMESASNPELDLTQYDPEEHLEQSRAASYEASGTTQPSAASMELAPVSEDNRDTVGDEADEVVDKVRQTRRLAVVVSASDRELETYLARIENIAVYMTLTDFEAKVW